MEGEPEMVKEEVKEGEIFSFISEGKSIEHTIPANMLGPAGIVSSNHLQRVESNIVFLYG